MIYFESLGLLLMSLILLKFTRLSRPLSLFYRLLERPLSYLLPLLVILCLVYTSLGYLSLHLWGVTLSEFRRLNKALYTLLTLFTLHSDQVYFFIHPLYRFNEWWAFTVVIIHLVFMQYTFMNVVTGVIFEEHRMAVMLEVAAKWKSNNTLGAWLRTGWCCMKRREEKDGEEEGKKEEETKEVDSLREKMREEREKRKRRRSERNTNMI